MNFIEELFGLSPDAGSGALELLLFLVPVVAALAYLRLRSYRWKR